MSKKEVKTLVPKLRFPEFRDAWSSVKLGKCFNNVGGTALEKYVTNKGTHHFISIGNYSTEGKYIDKGQRVEANEVTKTKLLNRNDLVMVLNDKTLAGDIIGSTLLIDEDDKYIYNQRSERLVVNSGLSAIFSWHLLNSWGVRKEVFKRSQGGTQIYVNFPSVKKINLAIPQNPKEQQKIADFLSSVDDLITAQAQKIDALKAHKKGLMQQLFPVGNKSIPKLRFPEFRDAGEWHEKPLGKICDFLNNRRKPITSNNREKGIFPYYGASGIVDYVKDYIFDERLLLIGEDGAKWGAFERTAFIVEGKYWVNNHAHVLRSNEINDTLLENYLVKLDLGPYITGAAPPKLTLGKLKEVPVPFPSEPKEQQKIADCLSSVDELITAQAQKLDALKAHKKGLMQQLFPSPDEVSG